MFYIEEKLSLFKGFVEARKSVPNMGTRGRRSQWCNRLLRSLDLIGAGFSLGMVKRAGEEVRSRS